MHDILIVSHIVSTSIMVGVIWVMQLLHYPTLLYVKNEAFRQFQNFHMRNISIIVVPIMLIELASGLMIYLQGERSFEFLVSFALLIILWIMTGLLFTKFHSRLRKSKDIRIINKMIFLNWYRTLFWSMRLIIIFLMF